MNTPAPMKRLTTQRQIILEELSRESALLRYTETLNLWLITG
jgi:hypothetical protein